MGKGVAPARWRLESGHVGLDLVNTRQARWAGGIEQLETPEHLASWLLAAGLVDERPRASPAELAAALALRESIDALVVSVLDRTPAPRRALGELNRWLMRAADGEELRLSVDDDRRPVLVDRQRRRDDVARALHALAVEAARMVGTSQRERLRVCGDAGCSMRFLDRSNANSRRWCSPSCCTRHHMRERRKPSRTGATSG